MDCVEITLTSEWHSDCDRKPGSRNSDQRRAEWLGRIQADGTPAQEIGNALSHHTHASLECKMSISLVDGRNPRSWQSGLLLWHKGLKTTRNKQPGRYHIVLPHRMADRMEKAMMNNTMIAVCTTNRSCTMLDSQMKPPKVHSLPSNTYPVSNTAALTICSWGIDPKDAVRKIASLNLMSPDA